VKGEEDWKEERGIARNRSREGDGRSRPLTAQLQTTPKEGLIRKDGGEEKIEVRSQNQGGSLGGGGGRVNKQEQWKKSSMSGCEVNYF